MSTELQKQASRENGAKSLGPVTPAGKARSARNATTHGLTSSLVVLSNESQELYDQLLAAYREEWQPKGQAENDLVVDIANARWRLRRIAAIETSAIDSEMFINRSSFEAGFQSTHPGMRQADALQSLAIEDNNFLDKLDRYETRYSRAFDRAVRTLVHLQRLRGCESTAATAPKTDPPPPPPPVLQNEPGPASLLAWFQQIVAWLIALLAQTAAQSASARRRPPSPPRTLSENPVLPRENYDLPEHFSWQALPASETEAA